MRTLHVANSDRILSNISSFEAMINLTKDAMENFIEKNRNSMSVSIMTKSGNCITGIIHDAVSSDHSDEKKLLNMVKATGEIEIIRILCMWQEGCFDMPSYNFREMICDVHPNNKNAEMLVSGENCFIKYTIAETMYSK